MMYNIYIYIYIYVCVCVCVCVCVRVRAYISYIPTNKKLSENNMETKTNEEMIIMLYAFFWVIRWHLKFICQCFRIPCDGDTRCISITQVPVASVWVEALHSLFLYFDPPPLHHPPSNWLRLFSSQTFYWINTPTILTQVILHTYQPMKMEQRECSRTLACKLQMQVNHPEESTQYSEHRESLKSRWQ
jgi:glucan phosphoethanolaminetransferase (alkaline phosphatase superfamily)